MPNEPVRLSRRTILGSLVLGASIAAGGMLAYQEYAEQRRQKALTLNCSTCDERKADQLRLRKSLLEERAKEALESVSPATEASID